VLKLRAFMVTNAVPKPIAVPKSASDRFFFSGMAIGMALVVFIGFARTYYLSAYFGTHGTIGGRLFSPIVRVHAMLFTTWVLLFVAQTSLVATHRVAIHRRLGVAVGVVAAMMIVVGTATARDLARGGGAPAGIDPRAFLAVPLGDMAVFFVLVATALYLRRKKEAHKRLMLLAFTAILAAAVVRIPGVMPLGLLWAFGLTFIPVLALCVIYDLMTRRRVHPAYLWGGALLILSVPGRLMISTTHAWHRLAEIILVGK